MSRLPCILPGRTEFWVRVTISPAPQPRYGSGFYNFTDLPAGLYQITITTPTGSSNLADADGGNPNNITVILNSGEDRIERDFELGTAELTLDKSADPLVYNAEGDLITYSYLLTNSGNVNLYPPYSVTDDKATVTCPDSPSVLTPEAAVTCTATYLITPADLALGYVTNTATAKAKDFGGVDVLSNEDSATVYGYPDLTVKKTNDVVPPIFVGETFTWTIVVSNSNTTASFAEGQVVLSDPLPADATYTYNPLTDGPTPAITNLSCALDISNVLTCTAVGGPVTLLDGEYFDLTVDVVPTKAGEFINTATVDPGTVVNESNEQNNTSTDTVTVEKLPEITVKKYVSVDGGTTWDDANLVTGPSLLNNGTAPQFKFVIHNTGNKELTGITLTDTEFDTLIAAGCTLPAILTADDNQAGTGTDEYECIITAEWKAGQHANTATASGIHGGNTYSDTDDAHYFGAVPTIDVEKLISVDGGLTWDDADEVTGPVILTGTNPLFKFVVTNTGNVELTGTSLSDDLVDTLYTDLDMITLCEATDPLPVLGNSPATAVWGGRAGSIPTQPRPAVCMIIYLQ